MNKEQLVELGLSEEQAQSVIDGFGKMVPKSRLDDKISELKELQTELATRDTQLEELKPKLAGQEALLKQIDDLQLANQTASQEFTQKLKDTQLSNAIKLALNGKVQDLDIVSSLLDKSGIELDDNGNIVKGLDEQVSTLKELKSFLFVPDQAPPEPPKPQFASGNPAPPEGGAVDPFASIMAKYQ